MANNSTLRIAWRNLGRNRKRSALACAAIGLGQFAFLATAAIMHGYADHYFDSITGPLVGHVQILARDWREERAVDLTLKEVDAMLAAVGETPAVVQAAPRLYAPVLAALEEEGFMAVVVGVDPAVESRASGLLGDAVLAGMLGDGQVLVGRGLARRRGIGVGTELAVVGQDIDGSIASELYRVQALVDSPVDIVNSTGIVAALADVRTLLRMGDEAHEIVIHLQDADQVQGAIAGLGARPELAGAEIKAWREVVPQLAGIVELMNVYILVILGIVFLASAAGIANTMLMSTFERRRELGMLLALGATPGRLFKVVATEAALLGLLGVGLGTALGVLFAAATAGSGFDLVELGGHESFEVGFQGVKVASRVFPELYLRDVLAGVGAVLVTSFAACAWPMLHIARLEPVEAMRV
ncbi:MAG: FtsX-like permease family protein [Candidatus Latescibacteria bacterium]|jgi:ABC-type lipoprotein release transport system permease subunit|nr:FtsX-like permease family protein [Candidatus Latescibacterota bacterium]